MAEEEIVYVWWGWFPFGGIFFILLLFSCIFTASYRTRTVTRNADGTTTVKTTYSSRQKNTKIVQQARMNRLL